MLFDLDRVKIILWDVIIIEEIEIELLLVFVIWNRDELGMMLGFRVVLKVIIICWFVIW